MFLWCWLFYEGWDGGEGTETIRTSGGEESIMVVKFIYVYCVDYKNEYDNKHANEGGKWRLKKGEGKFQEA